MKDLQRLLFILLIGALTACGTSDSPFEDLPVTPPVEEPTEPTEPSEPEEPTEPEEPADPEPPVEEEKVIDLTEEGSTSFVMTAGDEEAGILPEGFTAPIWAKNNKLKSLGSVFAVFADTKKLTDLPAHTEVTAWKNQVEVAANSAYWVRYITATEYVYVKLRIAYVDAGNIGVEYKVAAREAVANVNANAAVEGKSHVLDFSIPRLNADNCYVEHAADNNGRAIFNFALEWDDSKKHAAWVAFSFDEITRKDVTGRTDMWDVDPELPVGMQTSNDNHRRDGFDRGHICASEDRVWSVAANEQTFYFSNISPQFNSFNGGFWAAFEYRVRSWSRYDFDKLYVAKGGSLNKLLVDYTTEIKGADGEFPTTDENGFTIGGLACPKYYYMAVLGEKDGVFQALGFWIEHRDDYGYEYGDEVPADVLQARVVSIDKLEEETGIDFFCNLPDELETKVESTAEIYSWKW